MTTSLTYGAFAYAGVGAICVAWMMIYQLRKPNEQKKKGVLNFLEIFATSILLSAIWPYHIVALIRDCFSLRNSEDIVIHERTGLIWPECTKHYKDR